MLGQLAKYKYRENYKPGAITVARGEQLIYGLQRPRRQVGQQAVRHGTTLVWTLAKLEISKF